MVVLADLFHKWIRATNVTFRPVSCVDTWAILLQSPESMQSACDAVESVCYSMFHINLDAQKSFISEPMYSVL